MKCDEKNILFNFYNFFIINITRYKKSCKQNIDKKITPKNIKYEIKKWENRKRNQAKIMVLIILQKKVEKILFCEDIKNFATSS